MIAMAVVELVLVELLGNLFVVGGEGLENLNVALEYLEILDSSSR